MAATKPVDLCTHLLPSGKLCRGIALRNERLCRAHIRNHRFLERERQFQLSMQRLGDQLDAMDLPDLLLALGQKLDRISSIVQPYPEARLTLIVAINRLNQLKDDESNAYPQPQPNQSPDLNPDLKSSQINQMLQTLMESVG